MEYLRGTCDDFDSLGIANGCSSGLPRLQSYHVLGMRFTSLLPGFSGDLDAYQQGNQISWSFYSLSDRHRLPPNFDILRLCPWLSQAIRYVHA